MSRIHEALKKAEQERAVSQGAGGQAGYASTPVAEASVYTPEPPPSITVPVGDEEMRTPMSSMPPMPSMSSPFSLEALLARSAQQEWKPDVSTMLFMNGDDHKPGNEEFRTLRSRLYHTREKMPLKKVLVTSALPKEGKSFTAANLAQVLARQHGRRVLLIDADLRGPRLHQMLGTTATPGLSDYLQGQCDEFSIVQRGPMENLYFIPTGLEIKNAAELIGNGKLKILLQRLEPLFDWIIVDSPPAVPVSDASVVAKACDGVLMVVRSNTTPVDAARKAREEFPDESLIGVVLNGTLEGDMPYARYYYEAYEKKGTEVKA